MLPAVRRALAPPRARRLLAYGQPVFETHPHLLAPGQLTPGISALEYYERRVRLMRDMAPGSCAVLALATTTYASGSVFHPFLQQPDFWYLTGWQEPELVAVLEKTTNDVLLHMYVMEKDPVRELWEGPRLGVQAAIDVWNADEASAVGQFGTALEKVLARCPEVYSDASPAVPSSMSGRVHAVLKNAPGQVQIRPLRPLIEAQRALKSPAEINVMREAGRASGRAYNEAYGQTFLTERTLASFLQHRFVALGCDAPAYVPVVAGGVHALSIHYTVNNDVLDPGDLVLVDAAGRLGGYCADISRTWPVLGTFLEPQRELYEAVLNVQRQCVALCTETSGVSLSQLHRESVRMMAHEVANIPGLRGAGITSVYPHAVGHYLGVDLHDTPTYLQSVALRRGHVVTVEPGLYIPDEPRWGAFRGMGVRIEDNVAVGRESPRVLTAEAAKEVVDVEAAAAGGTQHREVAGVVVK